MNASNEMLPDCSNRNLSLWADGVTAREAVSLIISLNTIFFFLNELIWNAWKEQTKLIRYFNSYLCQFSQIVFFYSSFAENTAVLPDCIKDSTVERKLLALAHLDKLSSALFQVLTTFKMSDLTISNLDTFSKEV